MERTISDVIGAAFTEFYKLAYYIYNITSVDYLLYGFGSDHLKCEVN